MSWLLYLKLPCKLFLIALLFFVPICFLSYLFVVQSLKDINIAGRERAGSNYFAGVWPSFEAAINGNDPTPQEADAVSSAGLRYDTEMDTGNARDLFSHSNPGAARIMAGQQFMQKIADGSYLTLDTDLDSTFVIDAVTTKIPEVAAASAALMTLARVSASGRGPTPDLAFAASRLRRSGHALFNVLQAAANSNADGYVRNALMHKSQAVLSNARNLSRVVVSATSDGHLSITAPFDVLSRGQRSMQADLNALWHDANRTLDHLLAKRVEHLNRSLYGSLSLASALLTTVLILMVAVSRSITRRLNDIALAMHEMRGGDLDRAVPHLKDGDEIGAIARTLEIFRNRLISLRAFEGDLIAQEVNKAAETRFREILDMSPIGIVIATRQADPLYFNASLAHMLGHGRAELMSRNLEPLLYNADGLAGRQNGDERVRDQEIRLTRDDGGLITCLISGEPIEHEGKQVMLRWVYDISARKKAEAQIRLAEARLHQSEKLASLGQLTAGVAHEIKNPLNFVNNFSDLSRGLLADLRERLTPAPLDQEVRSEVDELVCMISGNLEKVVQHGKRADSIVKAMLLHSRSGVGERRLISINSVVREALNLAYHGARAAYPGFDVSLEMDFDASAGDLEAFPQELTRVIVNLATNGFYAVNERKETGGASYKPTLSAKTIRVDHGLRILIRDNGTGIPDEIREKLFTPFFTTKPAGEGTGLGLSLSHDIIVKQHNGTIDVLSKVGEWTEFVITLPCTKEQATEQAQRVS